MSRDNKKNTGLFVACWFLVLLFLVILFFVKKDDIASNLQKTDFFGKVFGTTPEFVKNHKGAEDSRKKEETFEFDLLGNNRKSSKVYEEATGSENVRAVKEDAVVMAPPVSEGSSVNLEKKQSSENNSGKPSDASDFTGKESKSADEKNPHFSGKTVPAVKQTEVTLFFVVVDSDGNVSRKAVKRNLPKTDSPLTNAINALLSGPVPAESSKNCMTLIPEGTRLLGASVKDGIATLNFSEAFEFNSVGVEGYIAQLMQIVFTATEFPTVKSVQFLIEGVKKDYLGSEGQWIGSPLARSSF